MDMKILSIAASSAGWVAEFAHPDGSETESKVAVWAVVCDEDGYRVTGFAETGNVGFFIPEDCKEGFAGWRLRPETK